MTRAFDITSPHLKMIIIVVIIVAVVEVFESLMYTGSQHPIRCTVCIYFLYLVIVLLFS